MKKYYLLFFTVLICFLVNAQSKFGSAYSLSIPQGEMGDNIRPVHSLNISFLSSIKGLCNRLMVGAEMGLGNYAYVTKEQDLRFSDGSGIRTDVIYSSNVFNAALVIRTNLLSKGKAIPYINAKGGLSHFFSNILVEDPEDPSSCQALERKNIIKDNTFFAAYGGGIQLDMSLFAKKEKPGKYMIDIGINKIKGGRLNYINTKDIQSHVHTDPNNPTTATSGKGEPLNIQFINITTRTIHEHQVAELYNSPLRMLDIRIGMLFTL